MFMRVCVSSYFVLHLSVECWCSRNCATVFILVILGLFHVISGYCRNTCTFDQMHCTFNQFWTTTFKPAVVEEMHNSFGHWLHIWPNVQIKISVFVLIFRSRYFCKSHTYSLLLIRKESLQTTHRLFVVTAQQHQRSFSMSSVIGGKWKSFFLPLPKTLFLQRFVCWLVDLSVYWVSICLHCI